MNYSGDDYVMGHILQAAWATGGDSLRVDLLSGEVDPSPLAIPVVVASLAHYVDRLPGLVVRSNSDMSFVQAADMVITVDPGTRRPSTSNALLMESPYTCAVRICDDRGTLYEHLICDWWYAENPPGVGLAARQSGD
jgi:hypothetical protein